MARTIGNTGDNVATRTETPHFSKKREKYINIRKTALSKTASELLIKIK